MVSLVPLLSTILPIVASTLLLLVIFANIYVKIRRKFSISVNCWFCNSWTKVPYDDRNSFDCPTCSQYNGFTKDGDYNKIIPEQHDELMNKSQRVKTAKSAPSNGLCVLCNNNQQLKIFQLANFVPLVEENYDVEIEHFQEQLEKAYKLCRKCDKVLKKAISRQSAWMFGAKLRNMCSNGISKVASQISRETRKAKFFTQLDGLVSIILVCAVMLTTLSSVKVVAETLATYIPPSHLPIYKNLITVLNRSKIVEIDLLPYFAKHFKIEAYSAICALGLTLQAFKMLTGHVRGPTKVNNVLCWVILFLISWVRFSNFSSYILFIEAFCCVYLLATAFAEPPRRQSRTNGRAVRKLVKNLEYTMTDVSELSDFEDISCLGSSRNSSDRSVYSTVDAPKTVANVLNASFASARSRPSDADLSKSLNNLHLGGLPFRQVAVKRPKPVLSPPKFQNVDSWVAGGFWQDSDGVIMPVAQRTNLSRSSSESSGFGSQNIEFVPMRSNFFGEFDRLSLNGEFSRVSPINFGFLPPEFRRTPNVCHNVVQRVGSPLFKFNNEPYQRLGNWSDKANLQGMQSFHDLNSHNS